MNFWKSDTAYLFAKAAHQRGEYTLDRLMSLDALSGAPEEEMLSKLQELVSALELEEAESGGEQRNDSGASQVVEI